MGAFDDHAVVTSADQFIAIESTSTPRSATREPGSLATQSHGYGRVVALHQAYVSQIPGGAITVCATRGNCGSHDQNGENHTRVESHIPSSGVVTAVRLASLC